jgi:HSP20 family protein
MAQVKVQKVAARSDRNLPIFAEFDELADRIRLEAYRLFSRRGSGDGHALDDWLAAERSLCWPAAELVEADGAYELKVALPGFEQREISVTATPAELMIKASHKHEATSEEGEAKLRWSEFRSNDVYRRVEFPESVDVDKIEAGLKNGLLDVKAPKAPAASGRRRKIEVTAAS